MIRLRRDSRFGAALAALALAGTPAAAIPVFDATNHVQNMLQAARALEQINNQVKELQNQAEMLRSMGRHLERIDFPELEQVRETLERIDALMGEARGIEFRVDRLDDRFRRMFPEGGRPGGSDERVAAARERLGDALESFRHSMTVQSQVVENVAEDARLLDRLVERSQGSVGSLQAQQATNQLLALAAKQQLQLQNLLAAEFRSETMERARRAQAEGEARAATRRFLGSGKAYTPR